MPNMFIPIIYSFNVFVDNAWNSLEQCLDPWIARHFCVKYVRWPKECKILWSTIIEDVKNNFIFNSKKYAIGLEQCNQDVTINWYSQPYQDLHIYFSVFWSG